MGQEKFNTIQRLFIKCCLYFKGCGNEQNEGIKTRGYRKRKEEEKKGRHRGGKEREHDEDKRRERRAHGQAMVIGKTSGVGHTVWSEAAAAFFWPRLFPAITARSVCTIPPTR